MLVLVQRVDGDDFFEECFVYATYFLLVDFEYTTVHKTVEYGRGGGGALQQFGFGDFFYISSAEVAGEFGYFISRSGCLGARRCNSSKKMCRRCSLRAAAVRRTRVSVLGL